MHSIRIENSRQLVSAPILVALFATTMLLSATLLFAIQPMFTKMVLPMLGGSPAVWNTAMLFFQMVLLAGYAYAHLTTKLLSWRYQIILHAIVLMAAFAALPIAPMAGWTPPTDQPPGYWLIGLFSVSIGLPFFVVSSTAPLLQRWFAVSGHPTASDPYFLYGASNLGSIAALLAYPIVIQPLSGLAQQSQAWTAAYAVLALLIGFCAVAIRGTAESAAKMVSPPASTAGEALARPTWRLRMQWIVFAFVPSSMMLGVTTHISTDVAAAPLLWVLPLTLYLLSFVFVFSRRPALKQRWMVAVQPYLLLLTTYNIISTGSAWIYSLVLNLLTFFVCAMVLHSELVRRRPAASDLTEFYLFMSLGGMLGGVFNALLAPVLFDSVIEYPLALVLACLLRPTGTGRLTSQWRVDLLLLAIVLSVLALPTLIVGFEALNFENPGMIALLIGLFILVFAVKDHPARFALGVSALLIGIPEYAFTSDTLAHERSFFGVHRVEMRNDEKVRILLHGTTIHGGQLTDPDARRTPLTYYSDAGPFGQIARAYANKPQSKSVGVVGLGTGTLACYRQPGSNWTFYEIDPVVIGLARDSGLFHFLNDCAPRATIVPGDARLSLRTAPPDGYGMLFLDAFSSDAIPAHLLTREAIATYLSKLAPGGIIVFHISNRHLDLGPVLAGLAHEVGLAGRFQHHKTETSEISSLTALPVVMVVLARNDQDLAPLDESGSWTRLETLDRVVPWTDDYSNIFGAIRFKR